MATRQLDLLACTLHAPTLIEYACYHEESWVSVSSGRGSGGLPTRYLREREQPNPASAAHTIRTNSSNSQQACNNGRAKEIDPKVSDQLWGVLLGQLLQQLQESAWGCQNRFLVLGTCAALIGFQVGSRAPMVQVSQGAGSDTSCELYTMEGRVEAGV